MYNKTERVTDIEKKRGDQWGEREEGMGQVVPSLVGLWGGLGVLCKGH